jgi:hypothetical protein
VHCARVSTEASARCVTACVCVFRACACVRVHVCWLQVRVPLHAEACQPTVPRYGSHPAPNSSAHCSALVSLWRVLLCVRCRYLGCSVLLLVDKTYISRFWTLFEAWLAVQVGSSNGLRVSLSFGQPDATARGRTQIRTIHLANERTQTQLTDELRGCGSHG